MLVRYDFQIHSEIKVDEGDWPKLSFERDGMVVSIEKPISAINLYLSNKILQGSSIREVGQNAALIAYSSSVAVELDSKCENEDAEALSQLDRVAWGIIGDFKTWVRVLTGQYWIGYRERWTSDDRFSATLTQGTEQKLLTEGAIVGRALEYGNPLGEGMWLTLTERLAGQQRPAPSKLFFCDALLDLLEGDLPQAITTLAISCEVELHSLRSELLARKGEELRNLFEEYARYPFPENFRVLEKLGAESFSALDPESCKHINRLYELRNTIAHRGEYPIQRKREVSPITAGDMSKFFKAVERLLAWCDNQKLKL